MFVCVFWKHIISESSFQDLASCLVVQSPFWGWLYFPRFYFPPRRCLKKTALWNVVPGCLLHVYCRWVEEFITLAALPTSHFVSNNPLHSEQVAWQSHSVTDSKAKFLLVASFRKVAMAGKNLIRNLTPWYTMSMCGMENFSFKHIYKTQFEIRKPQPPKYPKHKISYQLVKMSWHLTSWTPRWSSFAHHATGDTLHDREISTRTSWRCVSPRTSRSVCPLLPTASIQTSHPESNKWRVFHWWYVGTCLN